MTATFYICACVAIAATLMAITRASAMHALLYLIVSLLAIALIFYVLGAPFVAALEVIIYAGAIMVLFVFVIMMLNPGSSPDNVPTLACVQAWVGPSILGLIVLVELLRVMLLQSPVAVGAAAVAPKEVALSLFGPYVIGVELASLLLLAALVSVYHLGRGRQSTAKGEG
jgi:NADH-quinone oxidoreductase subunit J